jgi:hypothetical protein
VIAGKAMNAYVESLVSLDLISGAVDHPEKEALLHLVLQKSKDLT